MASLAQIAGVGGDVVVVGLAPGQSRADGGDDGVQGVATVVAHQGLAADAPDGDVFRQAPTG